MKIVINKCYGGFSLSKEAYEFLGLDWDGYGFVQIERHNPKLVSCVEKLGYKADGEHASLKVVEIPDDIDYTIEEYDGIEWISFLRGFIKFVTDTIKGMKNEKNMDSVGTKPKTKQ